MEKKGKMLVLSQKKKNFNLFDVPRTLTHKTSPVDQFIITECNLLIEN